MSIRLRKALFWLFALVFIVAAPGIVLYTAGYRYNLTSGRLQRTGVIAIATSPRGATILVDGKEASETSPYVLQRLMPDNYTVELARRGYQTWTQDVAVESGRTTYVNATLFADAEPELLLEEPAVATAVSEDGRTLALLLAGENGGTEMWLYDVPTRTERLLAKSNRELVDGDTIAWATSQDGIILVSNNTPVLGWRVDGTSIATDFLEGELNRLPEYAFVDNGVNVELVRSGDPTSSYMELVALLPYSAYTVVYRDDERALLHDGRGRMFALRLSDNNVTELTLPSPLIDKHDETGLFVVSDGYEIAIANLTTNASEFVTRQSDRVVALAWHPRGDAIFVATSTAIIALDRTAYISRTATPIAAADSITTMWPDQTGRNLYFFGSVNGITGLYRVRLVK